ncbi:MAG: LysR family transcriptional regulator [Clostridium sp.]|nr:LysR family transcriptional regulator [Clostridium sp.]
MTFEQIEYFIAAATADTFFDAAEQLHTTQSNVSKQIMKLEKELNIALFDRSRRSAVLTDAGHAFYENALKLSALYQQTLQTIQEYRHGSANTLKIGTLPILNQYSLTGMMKNFSKEYSQIRLLLTEAEEQELQTGLEQNHFDLIIARSVMADSRRHIFYPLAEDCLAAILPATHPFSAVSSVSLKSLSAESFLLMPPFTSIYQICMAKFQEAGMQPTILRTARMESLISAVAVGEGICLLPERNYQLFRHEGTVAIPLKPEAPLAIGCIVKRNRRLPAANSFIQFAQDFLTCGESCEHT